MGNTARAGWPAGWTNMLLACAATLCGCSTGEEPSEAPGSVPLVTTYYANASGSIEASSDRLSKVDLVFYAFWGLAPDGHLLMTRPDLDLDGSAVTPTPAPISLTEALARFPASHGYLQQACALREEHPELLFRLSLGGWANGANFSPAFSTAGGRDTFAADTLALVTGVVCPDGKPLFDGIDLDWEYPQVVIGGVSPAVSPDDGTNLHLAVLKARQVLGATRAISITLPHGDSGVTMAQADSNDVPGDGGSIRNFFTDASGQLAADNAAFVEAVSAFTIMTYCFASFALATTPDAPTSLDAALGLPDIEDGLAAMESYGVPSGKILLGAPAFGHSIGATVSAGAACLQAEPTAENHGVGIPLPDFTAKNPNGTQGPCSITWINYSDFAAEELGNGAFDLSLPGSDQVLAYWYGQDLSNNRAASVLRPGAASLPVLSQYLDNFLSFDGPPSITAKAALIKQRRLAGIAFWEVSQDLPYQAGDVVIEGKSYPLSLVRTAVEALE